MKKIILMLLFACTIAPTYIYSHQEATTENVPSEAQTSTWQSKAEKIITASTDVAVTFFNKGIDIATKTLATVGGGILIASTHYDVWRALHTAYPSLSFGEFLKGYNGIISNHYIKARKIWLNSIAFDNKIQNKFYSGILMASIGLGTYLGTRNTDNCISKTQKKLFKRLKLVGGAVTIAGLLLMQDYLINELFKYNA